MTVRTLLLSVACLLFAAPVMAGELHDVTMDDSITVEGQALQLQGMGLRSKWGFKIYVAGLYLATPSSDAAAIVVATDAKVVEMAMLRALSAEKLAGGIEDAFQKNNTSAEVDAMRDRLSRLLAMFPAVNKGDVVRLVWIPGKGTVFSNNGVELGTIEGQDFANALFACWMGTAPAQESLRDGMLGLY